MTDPKRPEDESDDELNEAAEPASAAAVAAVEPKTPTSSKTAKGTSPAQATDELPYVDDRVSKVWVALIGLTFVGILLYGLFLGSGGFLNQPTPEPSAQPSSPALSASPAATG